MDGVLCDFDRGFKNMFGVTPLQVKQQSRHFSTYWQHMVQCNFFAELEPLAVGLDLMDAIVALAYNKPAGEVSHDDVISKVPVFNIELLTSIGYSQTDEVLAQKQSWVDRYLTDYQLKVRFVFEKTEKRMFANKNSFLINDNVSVCKIFKAAGGNMATLTKDNSTTIISEVAKFVEK